MEILQRRKTNISKIEKNELNEEFIAMWKEGQSPWDVKSSLSPEKNKKDKSFKRLRLLIEIRWRFLISVMFLNEH